jgi:UDP-N-acetylglucosamine 1-carboxyvinyltransferase
MQEHLIIEGSHILSGNAQIHGAKNAVLVILASLILTNGKSRLYNVPSSDDVYQMIELLKDLGAQAHFDAQTNCVEVDTTTLNGFIVRPEIVRKIRASILIMGPLLARFKRAHVALPGGDLIGSRPIDFHLKAFKKMGADIVYDGDYLIAHAQHMKAHRFILEYPSVGATENILMAATLTPGTTVIANAAIEPEVLDLIAILNKMGARISLHAPATLIIEGVATLNAVEHSIIPDRLEIATFLLAAAATRGEIIIKDAQPEMLELVLAKLDEMGHSISVIGNKDIHFKACQNPKAVSFITMPYPGFPTDIQPMMMAALSIAEGTSVIKETVYENRFLHVRELQKMGAQINVDGITATIKGVDELYGASVIATDIRASASLMIAGLGARGTTMMSGIHHMRRGYQDIERTLHKLGAKISVSMI